MEPEAWEFIPREEFERVEKRTDYYTLCQCGGQMVRPDPATFLASDPPKQKWQCRTCGKVEYLKAI